MPANFSLDNQYIRKFDLLYSFARTDNYQQFAFSDRAASALNEALVASKQMQEKFLTKIPPAELEQIIEDGLGNSHKRIDLALFVCSRVTAEQIPDFIELCVTLIDEFVTFCQAQQAKTGASHEKISTTRPQAAEIAS